MNAGQTDVCAVVVTYHPDVAVLERLLRELLRQVAWVVVVDNGSRIAIQEWLEMVFANDQRIEAVCLGSNFGIAAAQNKGIQRARQARADYVILFDQDSEPAPDMVSRLLSAAKQKLAQGVELGAVAPAYADSEAGILSGFVRVGLFGFTRVACLTNDELVEADFLIASGSLIPMATLDTAGDMDEGLFIDHVDTEWCFRVKAKGYRLFGVCSARMIHSLGNRRSRVWLFRWRSVPYHSPFRYYYMFRNSVLLQRRAYLPSRWKQADLFRCLRAMLFFGVFSSQRGACLLMMLRGLRDGLAGVIGKMP